MSRHRLASTKSDHAYFIVGYDRPLGAFYLQVWEPVDADHPVFVDSCFDLDLLPDIGAVIPEGLRDILVEECLGKRDPNICHDWRKSCLPVLTPSEPHGD